MEQKFCIVDQKNRIVDGLINLSLSDAEHSLHRHLNLGFDCYIQEDDGTPLFIKNYREKKISRDRIYELIGIGFCQPKFYKYHIWRQAKALMDEVVCKLELAFPLDYGRGKGKYSTNSEIEEIKETVANLLCAD